MADITEILRQLAYYQAGGGKPSTAEEFGKFLTGTGQALGTAAKGFETGLDFRKKLHPEEFVSPKEKAEIGELGAKTKYYESLIPERRYEAELKEKTKTYPISNKESLAQAIVKGIKQGNIPPTFEGMGFSGVIPYVEKQLADEGINLKKMQLDWAAHKTLTKTMNQNQMVQLQTAFNTTKNDLIPMRQLNEEFNRVGFTPANKLILKADLGGVSLNPSVVKDMDQNQIAVATKFITQLNLMRDNMAVAFMRGGVPTDQAFKLTENILNPIYGSDQLGAALDQVEVNLNLRQSSVGEIAPYVPNQQPLRPTTHAPTAKPISKTMRIGIAVDASGNKARVEFDESGKIKRVLNEIR